MAAPAHTGNAGWAVDPALSGRVSGSRGPGARPSQGGGEDDEAEGDSREEGTMARAFEPWRPDEWWRRPEAASPSVPDSSRRDEKLAAAARDQHQRQRFVQMRTQGDQCQGGDLASLRQPPAKQRQQQKCSARPQHGGSVRSSSNRGQPPLDPPRPYDEGCRKQGEPSSDGPAVRIGCEQRKAGGRLYRPYRLQRNQQHGRREERGPLDRLQGEEELTPGHREEGPPGRGG